MSCVPRADGEGWEGCEPARAAGPAERGRERERERERERADASHEHHVSMRIHVWTGIGVKTAIEDGDNTYRGMRARGEGAGAMREPA